MKKKIKLRDMTEDQFVQWRKDGCGGAQCHSCPFRFANCNLSDDSEYMFYEHKDMFSDKFLDQEIEIEIEIPDILTPEEKEYLAKVSFPYRTLFPKVRVEKWNVGSPQQKIVGVLKDIDGKPKRQIFEFLTLSAIPFDGITQDDSYTLEELGL